MTPMNTKTGSAISVSLLMMPKMRLGNALRNEGSKIPVIMPIRAKIRATPASVNATGNPASKDKPAARNKPRDIRPDKSVPLYNEFEDQLAGLYLNDGNNL